MKNFTCAMGWNLAWTCALFYKMLNVITFNCKSLQIDFCTIQITIKKYFHHIVLYLSLFSLCAWSVDWKACFYEKKLMACYNFGPNAKKKIGQTIHLFEVVQKMGSNHSWSRISIISRFQKIFFNYGLSDF